MSVLHALVLLALLACVLERVEPCLELRQLLREPLARRALPRIRPLIAEGLLKARVLCEIIGHGASSFPVPAG